ncbi:Uncharacterised protein [Mycobacteroides abscessus subsp. abscessus]|nr:Uncharacterised protein [Mycobacteroides abscessus subsp. abscessus]
MIGVLRVPAAVVRRHRVLDDLRGHAGTDVGGGAPARGIDHREVVVHRHRNGLQPPQRLGHVTGDLEEEADDEGSGEPVPVTGPTPEGERDGQSVLIHPVEQPPQAVRGADHPAGAEARRSVDLLEELESVVVVAQQRGFGGAHRDLGAAGQEARRVPQGEHPGSRLIIAGELDEALPRGHELGHVLTQLRLGGGQVGAGPVAVAEIPGAVGRPHGVEECLPAGRGAVFGHSKEGERSHVSRLG